MRTTINLEDKLVDEARELTGIQEKTQLIHMGLKALIAQIARERLSKLAGTQPRLQPGRRRRTSR